MKYLSNPLPLFLLAMSLFFVGLGAVGFVGPDEPRYADVARAMFHTGDYVTPRLFGSPWFEKPPLYYWTAALFFHLGADELQARLPSAFAACGFIGVWFWFSRRLFGRRAGMLACIILASTIGWIGFAHAAVMDMLFSATLDAALVFLALWFFEKRQAHLYIFYLLLGIATLAKGPLAVGLAGLIALAYVATFREWKALRQILSPEAIGVFVVVGVPWYLLCYARNGYPFIQEFFLKHNWERYTSTALGHPQPFWFYVPVLLIGVFPWTTLLLLPVMDLFKTGARGLMAKRPFVFLFYWVTLPFIFFSFSQNKLPGYILPILPPLSLWIAQILEWDEPSSLGEAGDHARGVAPETNPGVREGDEENQGRVKLQRWAVWLLALSALALLIMPFLLTISAEFVSTGLRAALEAIRAEGLGSVLKKNLPNPAFASLAVPIGIGFYLLWRRSLLEAAFCLLVGVAMTLLGVVQFLSPTMNRLASVRPVAQRLRLRGVDANELAVYQVPRDQAYGLGFYMERELPEWNPAPPSSSSPFIIARDDVRIPDAQSRIYFPAQHLRLWELPRTEFNVQIESAPDPR